MAQENRENDDGLFAFILGMVLGAIGGGIAGRLYAPKKGSHFRGDVKDFLHTLPEKLENEMEPHSHTRQFIDRTRINLETQIEQAEKDKKSRRLAKARRREQVALGSDYNP